MKRKTCGCHNVSYVSDYGVIQLKPCFNLKLVTAITNYARPKSYPSRELNRVNTGSRSPEVPLG